MHARLSLGLLFQLALVLFIAPAFAQNQEHNHDHDHAQVDAAPADASVQAAAAELLKPNANDIIIGSTDAPVTLVEYASLSCGHCASFHSSILPELKAKYIDEGKVRIIFRHYPLNKPAVDAALLVDCQNDNDRKNRFLTTLFKLQDRWAFTEDYREKLKTIARTGGFSPAEFDACMADKAKEEAILSARLNAGKLLKVQSTPSIILNGSIVDNRSIEALSAAIDKALAQ